MFNKKFSLIGCLIVLVGLLGMGSGQVIAQDKITLRFAGWPEEASVKYNKVLIQSFEKKYPNLEVKYEPLIAYDLRKILTQMAAGVAPDVFTGWGAHFRTWIEKGQLLDLDPFISKYMSEEDIADFYPVVYQGMSVDGKQWALPKYANTTVLYYNKDLFDEVGLSYPKDITLDWDTFRSYAKKLTKREEGKTTQWGLFVRQLGLAWDAAFIWGNGGEINDPNNPKHFLLDQPETIEAETFLQDLIWKDEVAPLGGDVSGMGGGYIFNTGRIGMVMGGTADLYLYKQYGIDFDISRYPMPVSTPAGGKPKPGVEKWEVVSCDAFVIYRNTRYPEEAFKFLQHITSYEGGKVRLEGRGLQPLRKSLYQSYEEWGGSINTKIGMDALGVARLHPAHYYVKPAQVQPILQPVLDKIFILNTVSAEEGLKELVKTLETFYK
ncbi:Multiple sugar-binding protein [subsurface metagenome]